MIGVKGSRVQDNILAEVTSRCAARRGGRSPDPPTPPRGLAPGLGAEVEDTGAVWRHRDSPGEPADEAMTELQRRVGGPEPGPASPEPQGLRRGIEEDTSLDLGHAMIDGGPIEALEEARTDRDPLGDATEDG